MIAPAGWTLAIDFGTSNTVVVVKDQRGVNAVEFAGHRWFPSVVFADDNGGLISGLEAFNNRLVQPKRYFAEVKQTVTSRSPTVYVAGHPYHRRRGRRRSAGSQALGHGVPRRSDRPAGPHRTHPSGGVGRRPDRCLAHRSRKAGCRT